MSAHRFFLTERLRTDMEPIVLALSAPDVHHLVDVLRVRPGEVIEVVEPDGGPAWRVTVKAASGATVIVKDPLRVESSRQVRLTLVVGVSKGEKMDVIVRQAVEVGAVEIRPVLTARTVVRLDAAKRVARGERWRRIAKAAAEQSRRGSVPLVCDPIALPELADDLAEYDRVIVMWEEARDATGLEAAIAPLAHDADARVAVVVGPEGGLAAEEVELLVERGAVLATLGEGILRTETAAVVSLALVSYLMASVGARAH